LSGSCVGEVEALLNVWEPAAGAAPAGRGGGRAWARTHSARPAADGGIALELLTLSRAALLRLNADCPAVLRKFAELVFLRAEKSRSTYRRVVMARHLPMLPHSAAAGAEPTDEGLLSAIWLDEPWASLSLSARLH
jgi:hypothetical protein